MTEHVHDWYLVRRAAGYVVAECSCRDELTSTQIRHRLNATERLSAAQARDIADYYDPELVTDDGCACCADQQEELTAYASALERQILSTVVANKGAENKNR